MRLLDMNTLVKRCENVGALSFPVGAKVMYSVGLGNGMQFYMDRPIMVGTPITVVIETQEEVNE